MFDVLFGFHFRVYVFRIVAHDEIVFIVSQRIGVIKAQVYVVFVSALKLVWTEHTVVPKLSALLIKINTTVFFVVPDECFVVVMALKMQFVIGILLKSLTRKLWSAEKLAFSTAKTNAGKRSS